MRSSIIGVIALCGCFDKPPRPPGVGPTCTALALGTFHTCALDANGAVWCWGRAALGQRASIPFDASVLAPTQVQLPYAANQLAAGRDFTCAVLSTGDVSCWGAGRAGQLGDGMGADEGPVLVSLQQPAIDVVAGGGFACARLQPDLSLACWGINEDHEVSPLQQSTILAPMAVDGTQGTTAFGAGHRAICAVDAGGSLSCWGKSTYGQLGDTTNGTRTMPAPTLGFQEVSQVGTGARFTCALETDGAVRCIGNDDELELGRASSSSSNPTPGLPVIANGVAVTTGGLHACALDGKGAVQCWGRNSAGQVGVGSVVHTVTPTKVLDGAQLVVAGSQHTCAVVGTQVMCWGQNGFGELGRGARAAALVPTEVPGIADAPRNMALSERGGCVETASSLYCFGDNENGLLGDGTNDSRPSPNAIDTTGKYSVVSVGKHTACAIEVAGGVIDCWGRGDHGQLGNGATNDSNAPVRVQGLSNMTMVSVGLLHVCAINNNNMLYCWGFNGDSELGIAGGDATTPQQVGLTSVTDVATGYHHTCAVANGNLYCWGLNGNGELGDGTYTTQASPTQVALTGVSHVTVGVEHTCAVVGGTVYCWGNDGYGQLGNSSYMGSNTPRRIQSLAVDQLVAGAYTTCALVTGGGVACWGAGHHGELADNVGASEVNAPRIVSGLSATAIAAGGFSVCAIRTDGKLVCWGANDFGQLGLGLDALGASPAPVVGLSCTGS